VSAEDMHHVIYAIISVLYTQNIGPELLSEAPVNITTAPSIFDVWIPFFVETPSQRPPETQVR
jgi:hypothetical protein